MKAIVHDTARPYVNETGIVGFAQELLRRNVRLAAAKAGGHVDGGLPRQAVDSRRAIVTNLQMALGIEEKILGLDVAVSNALAVEIGQARKNLLEAAFDFTRGHTPALDRCVKIATGTVLHHFTPVLIFVLNKVNSLDDVRVV